MGKRKTGNTEPADTWIAKGNGERQILLCGTEQIRLHLFHTPQDINDMNQSNFAGLVQMNPVRTSVEQFHIQ